MRIKRKRKPEQPRPVLVFKGEDNYFTLRSAVIKCLRAAGFSQCRIVQFKDLWDATNLHEYRVRHILPQFVEWKQPTNPLGKA